MDTPAFEPMPEKAPCPKCGDAHPVLSFAQGWRFILCRACRHEGPRSYEGREAVRLWNKETQG
jgi:hypothetical protein